MKESQYYDVLNDNVKARRLSSLKSSNVENVTRHGDFYSVIVNNEKPDGQVQQGHYLLKGNEDGEELKIVNYEPYR